MLESVVDAVVDALGESGLNACRAYPAEPISEESGTLICVSVSAAAIADGGFAGYLGIKTDESGAQTELFGMRCESELALDIYVPMGDGNGADGCARCFDAAAKALRGIDGFRIREMSCGEAVPDSASGLFRCRCGAKVTVFLSAEGSGGEMPVFSDFILRGELGK